MQAKDKFSKRTNLILFLLINLITKILFAESVTPELLNYNKSLKNSSALFIQSDGVTLEEGIIYIGKDRIKIDYLAPTKVSLILSGKKSMYLNHELEEAQFFNTKKSFIKIFFNILTESDFYENSKIVSNKNTINVKNKFEVNQIEYFIEIIYENNPVIIRKIKIEDSGNILEISLYNHTAFDYQKKGFFSLINPYLKN
jgi:outer membrane lipoprotein-sorting protein